eukprot:TRINITY_DN8238_c0_g2_i2.p2 TRINITY_DN8238_c0_g2~~TRINITY_DN8238_c0_g2_i2.p2  ORF type:complete len:138 (+),score=33.98 TRINITY_DN8238_c0_g2_i2:194-607(+)
MSGSHDEDIVEQGVRSLYNLLGKDKSKLHELLSRIEQRAEAESTDAASAASTSAASDAAGPEGALSAAATMLSHSSELETSVPRPASTHANVASPPVTAAASKLGSPTDAASSHNGADPEEDMPKKRHRRTFDELER